MEIVHQLPGRVRFRIAELDSIEYCHGVLEWLKRDARIKSALIKTACNSLTVYYDAAELNVEDIFDLLSKDKITKPPAVEKKPVTVDREIKAEKEKAEKIKKTAPPAAKKKPVTGDGALKTDEEKAAAAKKKPVTAERKLKADKEKAAAALVPETKKETAPGAPKKKAAGKRVAAGKPRKRAAAAAASKKSTTAKKKISPRKK